jgi:hypothetical protein
MVTDWSQYELMKSSMQSSGFNAGTTFCAFDNTVGNRYEPYELIGRLIEETVDDILMVCHQDIRFTTPGAKRALIDVVRQLDALDPAWAICGPAGVTDGYEFVVTLDDPVHDETRRTELARPELVHSLDECLLVLKPRTGLRPSRQLSGFHLYGTDLSLRARVSGMGAYVVPIAVTHLSEGSFGEAFRASTDEFRAAWSRRFILLYTLRSGELCLARWAPLRTVALRGRVKRVLLGSRMLRRLMLLQFTASSAASLVGAGARRPRRHR